MPVMTWLRGRGQADDSAPVDVEALVRAVGRKRMPAGEAIDQLTRERKRLERQRTVVDRQFNRLTSGRVKVIARSSSGNPQIAANMLSDAMREADAANELAHNEQLAAIDARIERVERAIDGLRSRVRG